MKRKSEYKGSSPRLDSRLLETVVPGRAASDTSRPESAPQAAKVSDLAFPFKVGVFTVYKILAPGGMSITCLGHGTKETDRVVIKLPLWHDDTTLKRFRIEIEHLKSLKHPSIVRMRASGDATIPFGAQRELKRLPCLAMEFIDGQSLRQRITNEGSLSWNEVKKLLTDLLDALDYLHGRHLCHLDIKPDNIIYDTKKRRWVLVDFGISKSLADTSGQTLTLTAQQAGSWAYMSPEQLSDEKSRARNGTKIDIRSDIYSLGTTAWEALTGVVPRHGASRPSEIKRQGTIPPEVDLLLLKMAKQELGERYATPKEVIASLKLSGLQAASRNDRSCLRKRLRRYSLLIAGFVGIAITGWCLGDYIQTQRAKDICIAHSESPTRVIRELSHFANHQMLGWANQFITSKTTELGPRAENERKAMANAFLELDTDAKSADPDKLSLLQKTQSFLKKYALIFDDDDSVQYRAAELLQHQLQEAIHVDNDRRIAEDALIKAVDHERRGDSFTAFQICKAAAALVTTTEVSSILQARRIELATAWAEKRLLDLNAEFLPLLATAQDDERASVLVKAESQLEDITSTIGTTPESVEKQKSIYDNMLWQLYFDSAESMLADNRFAQARQRAGQYESVSRFKYNVVALAQFLAAATAAEDDRDWATTKAFAEANVTVPNCYPRAHLAIKKYQKDWPHGTHIDDATALGDWICTFAFSQAERLTDIDDLRYQMRELAKLYTDQQPRHIRLTSALCYLTRHRINQLTEASSTATAIRISDLTQLKYDECAADERAHLKDLLSKSMAYIGHPTSSQARWEYRWSYQRPPQSVVPFCKSLSTTVYRVTLIDMRIAMSASHFSALKGSTNANPETTISCGPSELDVTKDGVTQNAIYTVITYVGPDNSNTVSLSTPITFFIDLKEAPKFLVAFRDADTYLRKPLATDRHERWDSSVFLKAGTSTAIWDNGSSVYIAWTSQ